MKKNLWFWLAVISSSVSLVVGSARILLSSFANRQSAQQDNPAAWALVLLLTMIPWILRLVHTTESFRIRSEAEKVNEVFCAAPSGPAIYRMMAKEFLSKMRTAYESLTGNNEVQVSGSLNCMNLYRDLFRAFLGTAPRTMIRATSRINSWDPDLRALNWEFLKTGGTIHRIFIFDSEQQKDAAITEAELQLDGCTPETRPRLSLFLCNIASIEEADLTTKAKDFVINGDAGVGIVFDVAYGKIGGGMLIGRGTTIQDLVSLHERLESKSTPLPRSHTTT